MRSVHVPARRLSILALAFVAAVGISACSEPAQEPQPIVLVITATPADTPTPVVIVVTATPLPPTPTLVPGFAGRLRVAGEEYSESTATPVIATSTSTPTPDPTRTPFPTSTPEIIVAQVAVETPTAVPTEIPVPAPTQFVCGYAEMVLIGAGKAHKPCITPTATAKGIFYDTATPEPTRTPSPARTPIPTATPPVIVVTPSRPAPTVTSTPRTTATQPTGAVATFTPTPSATAILFWASPPEFDGMTIDEILVEGKPEYSLRELEDRVFELINVEREKNGVEPLKHVSQIQEIARAHSQDLIDRDYFEHDDPEGNGPTDRAREAEYICEHRGSYGLAENIAGIGGLSGYTVEDGVRVYGPMWRTRESIARELIYMWMNSEGHRRNLLRTQYKATGVGIALGEFGEVRHMVIATQNFC